MTTAQILVVDDEADIRMLIEEILSEEGYRVETAADAAEARNRIGAHAPDLVLLDIWMPDTDGITLLNEWSREGTLDCPVVIMSGHGTVETAVEATRLGAVDYIEKPLSLAKLLRTVETALDEHRTARKGAARSLIPPMITPVGKSRKMRELREAAQQIALHSTPVLITGESGTGREAFARYLHSLSDRSDRPMVVLVAGALAEDNAANALLGTETAGVVEPGYLEQAKGSTLFINELGDLCAAAQRLLLGVLEQGSFARVGRAQQMPLDVRVIASIRPEVEADPEAHGVRADLIERLAVLQLRVPALREYAEDVSELLRHFVDKIVDANGLPYRRFSVAAQNRLRNYPWPGNVRELSHLVQRLLVAGGAEEISLEQIERELAPAADREEPLVKQDLLALPLREAREQFERAYLKQQLSLCGGKVGQLAKRVGMERTHLYRKLRSLGVDFRQAGAED
jgi:DNA-binding NtrC family response regulator